MWGGRGQERARSAAVWFALVWRPGEREGVTPLCVPPTHPHSNSPAAPTTWSTARPRRRPRWGRRRRAGPVVWCEGGRVRKKNVAAGQGAASSRGVLPPLSRTGACSSPHHQPQDAARCVATAQPSESSLKRARARRKGRDTPLACRALAPRHSASARPPPPPRHCNYRPHAHSAYHRWPRGRQSAREDAFWTPAPGGRGARLVGWPRGGALLLFPPSTHLVGGHSHGRQGNTTEGEVHGSCVVERGVGV